MKKVFILFSGLFLASCDKDALIPVGTGNGATVQITGISSVGFNLAMATGYLNFQLFKTNEGSVSPANALEFDNLIKDKLVLNSGTIFINPQNINLINWFLFPELNSILNSTLTGDYFALVVSGYFVPLETGIYTFTLEGDDSQELSLDGKVVIGNYGPTHVHAIGTHTGTAYLIANKIYGLKVRLEETNSGEGLRFFWKKPSNQANWIQDANELRATLSGELPKGPVVNTVVSKTGRIWMDRNLGASQVATSPTDEKAFGDLYQWGRPADGHQLRISGTTTNLSSTDQPGNSLFILNGNAPQDWRVIQNNNLWQGLNGVNKVCPIGFRLPTNDEWGAEKNTWNTKNNAGAFSSPLKLPSPGGRTAQFGNIDGAGLIGDYWSSSANSNRSFVMVITNNIADLYFDPRAYGYSVRCIKD